MDEPFSVSISNLPILNSLLAMRISALGMMGGGRQNCSLYALLRATETGEESNTNTHTASAKHVAGTNLVELFAHLDSGCERARPSRCYYGNV